MCLELTRVTKTAILPRLAERQSNDRDAFRRVAIDQALTWPTGSACSHG